MKYEFDVVGYYVTSRMVKRPTYPLKPGDEVVIRDTDESYIVVSGSCGNCCLYNTNTCIRWLSSGGYYRCILSYRNRKAANTLMFIRPGDAMEEL